MYPYTYTLTDVGVYIYTLYIYICIDIHTALPKPLTPYMCIHDSVGGFWVYVGFRVTDRGLEACSELEPSLPEHLGFGFRVCE